MIIKTRAESGILFVDATGEFSLEEAKRTFLEMLVAISHNKVNKVLVDGRQLEGEPETMERFYYGDFAAQSVKRFTERDGSANIQFAYVLHEPVLDPQRFGEQVARNRGMFIKCFDNLKEALGWLGNPAARKPDAADG